MNLNWQVQVRTRGKVAMVTTVAAFDDRQEALDWMAGRDYTEHDYTLTYKED